MELKVKTFTTPEVIDFNFEALKKEITEAAALYKSMVYTEEQIKGAKADRAKLNKFNDALSAERIKIKKECLKPYEDFEAKIKILTGIINEAVNNIDKQIKEVEDKKKVEKLEKIKEYFDICIHPDWLRFNQIFDEKWLNASVTLKKVQEDMVAKLEKISADLVTIQQLPDFSFEAAETYKATLDINKAIEQGQELLAMQKRKAEAEQAAIKPTAVEKEPEQPAEQPSEPLKSWINFSALLSVEDAGALSQFFKSRNIEYKAL